MTLAVRNTWSKGVTSNKVILKAIHSTFIVFICQKQCSGDAKMDKVPFPALKELTF